MIKCYNNEKIMLFKQNCKVVKQLEVTKLIIDYQTGV